MSCACLLAKKNKSVLTIGLTGDELLNKKQGKVLMQTFFLREHYLKCFLAEFHPFLSLEIIELSEPCGPTKSDPFDGLIVTCETIKGSEYINNIRKENGLAPLKVYVTGLVNREQESKLSSGDIRKEILVKCPQLEKENIIGKLREIWFREIKLAGFLKKEKVCEIWLDKLLNCYFERWRYYHTVLHIWEMIILYEEFYTHIKEKFRVLLAIWFHDAYYLPGDDKNEEVLRLFLRNIYINF